MFNNGHTDHPDEIDDSDEVEIICSNEALRSLRIVNLFLLQQKNASEQIKLAGKLRNLLKKKNLIQCNRLLSINILDNCFNFCSDNHFNCNFYNS